MIGLLGCCCCCCSRSSSEAVNVDASQSYQYMRILNPSLLILQTFNHFLLLFYRDHFPQLFLLYRLHFGPSMDKAKELVPVFQKQCHNLHLWIIDWGEPQIFTRSSAIFLRSKLVIEGYLPIYSCMYSRLLNRRCRWKCVCWTNTVLILVSVARLFRNRLFIPTVSIILRCLSWNNVYIGTNYTDENSCDAVVLHLFITKMICVAEYTHFPHRLFCVWIF